MPFTHPWCGSVRGQLLVACLASGAAWGQSPADPATVGLPAAAEPAGSAMGIVALWASADAVTMVVLLVLLLMSLGSWYTLARKWLGLRAMQAHGRAARSSFWRADTALQGMQALQAGSPYRHVASAALQACAPQDGLLGRIDQQEWLSTRMQRAVESVQHELHSGLAFLATVGSVAPFVGLFGTVWGIYHALAAIGLSAQASIDRVAGPVGEALIMTALGLAVAVPAVLAYNWALSRNRLAMAELRAFASDLHAVLAASPQAV